jgi:hypothetical protein
VEIPPVLACGRTLLWIDTEGDSQAGEAGSRINHAVAGWRPFNDVALLAVVNNQSAMVAEGNPEYPWSPPDAAEEIDEVTPFVTVPRPSMVVSIREECVRRMIRASGDGKPDNDRYSVSDWGPRHRLLIDRFAG